MSGQINKAETDAPKAKKGGKGLLVAVVLAVIAGGAGYYATSSGLIALPGSAVGEAAGGNSDSGYGGAGDAGAGEAASFVPLQSLVISLGPQARAKHLQFTAQLEVVPVANAQRNSSK